MQGGGDVNLRNDGREKRKEPEQSFFIFLFSNFVFCVI